MSLQPSAVGLKIVKNWLTRQQQLKRQNPQHRVVIDPIMESMHAPTPRQLIGAVYGEGAADLLKSPASMRGIEMHRLWSEIQKNNNEPVSGAGGLGIIGETIATTAAQYGAQDGYGLLQISLLHTNRRTQLFEGNRQQISYSEGSPEASENYLYLGTTTDAFLYGKKEPVDVWLFRGFDQEAQNTLSVRLSKKDTTGIMYPSHASQLNFDQMQVLGQGGFRLAQTWGLLGVDQPLADLVIGHDGHTALFKFNIFLYFYDKYNQDSNAALAATRKLCVATIHAPQNGTVPRTTGDMVAKHYDGFAEKLWGRFGVQPGAPTNALFAEMQLAKTTGVVSPIHLLVTSAEEKARQRGFAENAHILLPGNVSSQDLKLFPDAISVDQWLGLGTKWALDQHCPGWEADPAKLLDPVTRDNLRLNKKFRGDLADAFCAQDNHLADLFSQVDMKFGVEIQNNAILFASLRRATSYKIGLISSFLKHYKIMDKIGEELGRPIFYLFGGLAHQDDLMSIDSLSNLLGFIEKINSENKWFKADFLVNYGKEAANWIFPGLAKRGCWVGCTNPFGDSRSQGTEAFGPSYAKSAINGLYIMGSSDGGAGCLHANNIPTVSIYGPTTFVGEHSFHNDLWSNQSIGRVSEVLLANGFIGEFRAVAAKIAADLARFDRGRGGYAPGMSAKIDAILRSIGLYNGRVLMESYLNEIDA